MARKFKLNTGSIATLSQVVAAMPSGKVYDHLARATAGTVTLAENEEGDAAELRQIERGGFKVVTET